MIFNHSPQKKFDTSTVVVKTIFDLEYSSGNFELASNLNNRILRTQDSGLRTQDSGLRPQAVRSSLRS